jgi:hypothetical protein
MLAVVTIQLQDGNRIAHQVFGEGPVDLVTVPGFISNVETMWDLAELARYNLRLATLVSLSGAAT